MTKAKGGRRGAGVVAVTARGTVLAKPAAEQAKGPDNNKRLAFLEERSAELGAALLSGQGYELGEGEDPATAAIALLAGYEATRDDSNAVAEALFARGESFTYLPGETSVRAGIRVIGELDAELAPLKSDASTFHDLINERPDFVRDDDETAYAATVRLVGQLDAGMKQADEATNLAYKQAGEDHDEIERLAGEIGRLTIRLSAVPDFDIEDGETTVDAAIRLLDLVETAADADAQEREAAGAEPAAGTGLPSFAEVEALEKPVSGALAGGVGYRLLAEDSGSFIAGQPSPEATAADFEQVGDRAVYKGRIIFRSDGPPARVTAMWLIAHDRSVRCEIPSGGLRIGGGAEAVIPAGHLIF